MAQGIDSPLRGFVTASLSTLHSNPGITPRVSGTQFHIALLVAEGGDRVEVHGAEGGKDASRQGGKE